MLAWETAIFDLLELCIHQDIFLDPVSVDLSEWV